MADAGLRMVVEGEKKFKAAIADINAQMKLLGSEMKLATSEFDKNEKSVESLTARNNVLTKEIDAQKSKVETLKAALKSSADTYGENDEKTQKWAIQLNNAQAELNGMERELAANAKEAEELGKNIKDSGDKAEKSGPKWEKLGSVLKGIGGALAGVATAAGTAAVKLGKDVIDSFGELEQNLGGSEAVFGEYAAGIMSISEEAYRTMGTSQSEYLATANKMGALFQGAGVEQQRSLELTTQAMQRATDMASVMGIDTSAALEAVTGAAKGNYTMMDNLGVAMNATTLKAYAAAQGFETAFDQMSNAEKAEVAMQYFFEQTEQYAGNFEREATETISGSIGLMQASIESFVAGLGNADADMTNLTENMISAFQSVMDNITPVIENIVSALPEATGAIASALTDLLPELLATATSLFQQVLETLLGLLPELIPVAVEALMTIVKTLIDNVTLLIDSAEQLIGSLVDGVIDALPALIDAAVSIITKLCEMLGDPVQLRKVLDAALEIVMAIVGGLMDNVDELIDAAFTLIDGLVGFLTEPGNLEKLVLTAIELTLKIGEGLIKAIPQLLTSVAKMITNIKDTFTKTDWKSVGKNIVDGLLNGLKNAWHSLTSWFDDAWDNLVGGVKDLLGIHSPSTVFAGIGKNMGLGLKEGFVDTMSDAERAMRSAIPTDFGVHGDFAASGAAMGGNVYNITIDAANVREFNDIIRIAQGARRSRRLGYVGG